MTTSASVRPEAAARARTSAGDSGWSRIAALRPSVAASSLGWARNSATRGGCSSTITRSDEARRDSISVRSMARIWLRIG